MQEGEGLEAQRAKQFKDGDPGKATENSTRCGGTGRSGRHFGNTDNGIIIDPYVGGGAPLMGDGKGGPLFAKRPSSFINGGNLGNIPVSHGGFGGECIRL